MKYSSITTQSPGRINIIGEHTDYNNGFVLPAAIDKKTVFQLRKNGSANKVQIEAGNVEEHFSFDIDNFHPIDSGWQNYVMGVVHELQQIGATFTGFDGHFQGDVPIGGGMSSSASLECSLAYGLNELFELGLEKWQLIKASQLAEHNFVGIKCGIMDQFASMMGKKDHVMLLDCQSLAYEYYPFDLGDYQLLLLNTNVSHSLASSEYNHRRAACEEGVSILQQNLPTIQSLREVSLEDFHTYKHTLPPKIARRCQHVITENDRVLAATKALQQKDFQALGALIYASHYSLQNKYDVSCPELDYLVGLTINKDYILGSRMMGGGFGGCTLTVIEKNWVDPFIKLASVEYEKQFGKALTPYRVSIEDGSGVL